MEGVRAALDTEIGKQLLAMLDAKKKMDGQQSSPHESDEVQRSPMGLEEGLRPRITRKPGKTEIYLDQLLLSGVGGMEGHGGLGFETVLIVPASGQRVFLAQGVPPDICNYDHKLEVCGEFPKLLENLAEIVQRMRGRTGTP